MNGHVKGDTFNLIEKAQVRIEFKTILNLAGAIPYMQNLTLSLLKPRAFWKVFTVEVFS